MVTSLDTDTEFELVEPNVCPKYLQKHTPPTLALTVATPLDVCDSAVPVTVAAETSVNTVTITTSTDAATYDGKEAISKKITTSTLMRALSIPRTKPFLYQPTGLVSYLGLSSRETELRMGRETIPEKYRFPDHHSECYSFGNETNS